MPWWRNGFGYDISFTLAVIALVGASLVSFGIAERRYSIRYMTPAPSATALKSP